MAKNFLFSLILSALAYSPTFLLAFNCSTLEEYRPLTQNECTIPAPEDFRVTERSTNYISLAWMPSSEGSGYSLSVAQKNLSGGWDLVFSGIIVYDTFYTVGNLTPGAEYRFSLAARCSNGDPSIIVTHIEDGALILELVLGGRIPNNPQVVEDCANISLSHNWVGFRIDHQEGGALVSNYFEYRRHAQTASAQQVTWIMRARYDNPPIYAARADNQRFPTHGTPIIPALSPFNIIRDLFFEPEPEVAGFVVVAEKTFPPRVGLCVLQSEPWMSTYTFTPLVAESAAKPSGLLNPDDRIGDKHPDLGKPRAQNPFNETLTIFFPAQTSSTGYKDFRLLNSKGQLLYQQRFESSFDQVSIPTTNISPGVHYLVIESPNEAYTLKVVKTQE